MYKEPKDKWDIIINPTLGKFDIRFTDIWKYRDLLMLMVKRDFLTVYKQTILGPLWFILQPILTTIVFTVVFGKIANIPTNGLPPVLFYLSGLTVWTYFADTLNTTSRTFTDNASVFGKVYFPRLIMPVSKVISGLIKFSIQLGVFLVIMIFYKIKGVEIDTNIQVFIIPYLVFLMAGIGLGSGIILSSLTTKYRDLTFLVSFGVQLLMYATPVIIPLSEVKEKYQWIMKINPLTPVIETFRSAFLQSGSIDWEGLGYSSMCCCLLLFIGVVVFNRVEKSFIDTI